MADFLDEQMAKIEEFEEKEEEFKVVNKNKSKLQLDNLFTKWK